MQALLAADSVAARSNTMYRMSVSGAMHREELCVPAPQEAAREGR